MIRLFLSLLFLGLFLIAPNADASTQEHPFLPIKVITTPKSITYWFIQDTSQPILNISFGFKGAGAVNETEKTQGLTRLLSNTMDEGAGPYDSKAFQQALDDDAITLSFGATRDHFLGQLRTLTETRNHAAELLRLALTAPRFDEEAVKRMIDSNIARIRSQQPDPDWQAARLMNHYIYADHPYHLNSGGTLSTLPRLTPALLQGFKDNYLTRDRLRIGLVGDITESQASAMIDQIFGDLPVKIQDRVDIPLAPTTSQEKPIVYKNDIPQTIVMMSFPAPTRRDPDFAAFTVLNNILGGSGFGSRLMEQIREKAGLTYGIYSSYDPMDYASRLSITASTKNETAATLLQKTETEIAALRGHPVTKSELDTAKSYLLGSMAMALDSTSSIATLLRAEQLDDQKPDAIDRLRLDIERVTPGDLKRLARKWLPPEKATTILVGSPLDIKDRVNVDAIPNVK